MQWHKWWYNIKIKKGDCYGIKEKINTDLCPSAFRPDHTLSFLFWGIARVCSVAGSSLSFLISNVLEQMKESTVWWLPHLTSPPPQPKKIVTKINSLICPWTYVDILKKAVGLALKELKRVKKKSEIGNGSTVVWGLDEVENEINSPCHWQIQRQTVFTFLSSNSFSYSRSNRISPCQRWIKIRINKG